MIYVQRINLQKETTQEALQQGLLTVHLKACYQKVTLIQSTTPWKISPTVLEGTFLCQGSSSCIDKKNGQNKRKIIQSEVSYVTISTHPVVKQTTVNECFLQMGKLFRILFRKLIRHSNFKDELTTGSILHP